MTKGQTIGWSIGVGLFLLVVVALIIMNKDKISGALSGIAQNQPTITTYPDYCDKERVGYDIYGNANSDCGVIASEPYSAPCDPDRPGYDINGFARTDCWFGRKGNIANQPNQGDVQKSASKWEISNIAPSVNGSILTGVSDLPLRLRAKIPINVVFDFSDGTRIRTKNNILGVISKNQILVGGLLPVIPSGTTVISKYVA